MRKMWLISSFCMVGLALLGCSRQRDGGVAKTFASVDVEEARVMGTYLAQTYPGGRAVIFLAPKWDMVGRDLWKQKAADVLSKAMGEGMTVQTVSLPLPDAVQRRIQENTDGARGDESLLLQASMDGAYFNQVATEWARTADVAVLVMALPEDMGGNPGLTGQANKLSWALLDAPQDTLRLLFNEGVIVAATTIKDELEWRRQMIGGPAPSADEIRDRVALVTKDTYQTTLP